MKGLETEKKKKSKGDFWRACRYLGPHRRIVAISIVCAFVVGAAFTGGLGTVLPIMQVLVNGDTIENWVNRKIVEKRLEIMLLEVSLGDESSQMRLSRSPAKGLLAGQGLKAGQALSVSADQPATEALRMLSDPGVSVTTLLVDNARAMAVELPVVPAYLTLARDVSSRLPENKVAAIGVVLGFLIALAVFGNTVRFFQEYLSEKAAVLTVRDIRMRMYDHALHMSLGFYGRRGTSDITSRLTQDAQGLQEGLKQILGASIQEPIKAGMALTLALMTSWQLTLFIIGFAPVMGAIIKKFGKKIRRAARAALEKSSTMLGQIEGSLMGIRVVKASNAERFERRRFRGMANSLVGQYLRIARMEAFNTPVLELLTLVVVCAIVLWAAHLVLDAKALKPGEFFLVMACLMGIGESLRRISKINSLLQKSNAAAGRLFEVIDEPTERVRLRRSGSGGNGAVERPRKVLGGVEREVSFEGLTFAYSGSSNPAVVDVNLRVPKGQSIAVVGRNGSGKTTLLSLLPRFYDPQKGRIAIDGVDIRDVTLSSLRKQIGIVTQDSVIFPGTIASNIAYGIPLATREEIEGAAKRAFAHDFILEKAEGYDTVLGEHGAQLSGGQKQRLCIARAILRKTPILILDEATSQVDAESEHLIQQAIEGLMHERTTFVIAHRFSTILSADLIVVMDRGQIVGTGSHEGLLKTCTTYQQLYERQLAGIGDAG